MPRRNILPIALALSLAPPLLAAQRPLAERLRSMGTRTVAFSAATRADVCGDGIRSYGDGLSGPTTRHYAGNMMLTHEPWDTRIAPCERGPMRVTVRMVEGAPSWLRIAAGPLPVLGDSVTDIGMVSVAEAGAYLRMLAREGEGRTATSALMPLILLDSTPRWDVLIAAARDSTRPQSYRRHATDLLARAAAATIAPDGKAEDEERSTRREAVNALARRREQNEDVVPILLEIAQRNAHRDARVAALYQLGQTSDRRAIDLFAGLLAGRR